MVYNMVPNEIFFNRFDTKIEAQNWSPLQYGPLLLVHNNVLYTSVTSLDLIMLLYRIMINYVLIN
jgi:hypothetical protein